MDIGSGDRPHPRSNILLERFINDSSQREALWLQTVGVSHWRYYGSPFFRGQLITSSVLMSLSIWNRLGN
jgi:hypothetical protein